MEIFNATDKIEALKLKIFLWKSHVEESDITWPTSRNENLFCQKQLKQMKAVFSAQPRKLNFLSSARGLPPDSVVPSLSLAPRPGMGFLPHFIMHLLVTSSLSPIPSRPFYLTEAGLRALLSRHSWITLYETTVIIISRWSSCQNRLILLWNIWMFFLWTLIVILHHCLKLIFTKQDEIKSIFQSAPMTLCQWCKFNQQWKRNLLRCIAIHRWETCSNNVIVLNFGQKLYTVYSEEDYKSLATKAIKELVSWVLLHVSMWTRLLPDDKCKESAKNRVVRN